MRCDPRRPPLVVAVLLASAACSEPETDPLTSPEPEVEVPVGDTCRSKPEGRFVRTFDLGGPGGMAVLSDGTTWCWSLGPGPVCPAESGRPVKLRTLPCATAVRTSYTDAIAATVAGELYAWGYSQGPTAPVDSAPATWIDASEDLIVWGDSSHAFARGASRPWIPSLGSSVTAIAWAPVGPIEDGGDHACFVHDGGVYCAGENGYGQLGNGSLVLNDGAVDQPVRALVPARVRQVTAAGSRSLAIDVEGDLWAWGGAPPWRAGEPPQGATPERWDEVSGLCQIDDGNGAACTRTCSGEVRCWGSNLGGMIDAAEDVNVRLPLSRVRDLEPATHVSVGSEVICSLKTDGTVWCRGFRATGGGLPFRGEAVQVFFDEDAE